MRQIKKKLIKAQGTSERSNETINILQITYQHKEESVVINLELEHDFTPEELKEKVKQMRKEARKYLLNTIIEKELITTYA